MKLLKFYAGWCQPCKMQSQIIKQAGDKIKTQIEDIDIDNNTTMTIEYKVRSVPTMVLLDDEGKEAKRHVGVLNETKLLEFLGE
jgi:thioredoxin 1